MDSIKLDRVFTILDNLEKEESNYAAGYIKYNPDDKENRERVKGYIIEGIHRVYWAILNEGRQTK